MEDCTNQEEFYDNIKALDARDLSILHGMLMLDDEKEQKLYLRKKFLMFVEMFIINKLKLFKLI